MDNQLEPIVKKLQADFGAAVDEFRGEAHLTVSTERIVATLERVYAGLVLATGTFSGNAISGR